MTTVAPHARSYIDMKRIMTYVVMATIPCILMALYNTGYQANLAIAEFGLPAGAPGSWQPSGIGFNAGQQPAWPT